MKKIGVLEGCFGRWFTVSLQKQKSPHLIGQKSGTFPPLWQKVYILFTEINTPHLIGQKIAVLKGVPLKIYNLFTDQGHSLLNSHGNCKKSRLFSKNLSPHLYEKNRGSEGVFWKMIYSFFTKTKVSSSNRTKKWQNAPLAMKGLDFVYKI